MSGLGAVGPQAGPISGPQVIPLSAGGTNRALAETTRKPSPPHFCELPPVCRGGYVGCHPASVFPGRLV